MHISDGVIPGEVCAGAGLFALALALFALKKTDQDDIPRTAVMTSAFFIASLVHIRLGPSSTHLVMNGLMGVILGLQAFPAILVALLFQAVIFQHGGISTLGVNSVIIGLPAFAALLVFRLTYRKNRVIKNVFYFLSGFLPVMISALLMVLFLVLAGTEFEKAAELGFVVQVPLAALEGVVTLFIVNYLEKVKPGMLRRNQ